jgi:serine/threonine protein kinase
VVGTPKYMAPEAIEGHAQPASDQYALGALAYEWFCGTPPFTSDFLACLIYQHTSQPLPSLREKNEHIPQAVEKVIARALAKEPENRFPSVTAFASALERAVTHHQITAIHLQHWDEYGQSANDQSARSR